MKKKALYILIGIPIVASVIIASLIFWPRATTIGTVLSVSDVGVIIEVTDSQIADGQYVVTIDQNTVILDSRSKHIESSQIPIGSKIKVVYSGQILESNPAIIRTCYKIIIIE